MHHRVTAWVLASAAAPAILLVATLIGVALAKPEALVMAMVWQAVLAFILLSLSMLALSPFLLWPLERRQLSRRWKIALTILGFGAAVLFVASTRISIEFSMAVGLLLNALVYIRVLPRSNSTVERERL